MEICTQQELYEISQPRLNKIKVLFFVYLPSVWDSQRSVYQAMKESESFDVYVLIAPMPDENKRLAYRENALEFFKNEGIDFIVGCDLTTMVYVNIESLKMDVIFYQTPFYYGIKDWLPEYISQYSYLAYIPYGFYIADIPKTQFNQIIHNVAWRVFAETPLHKQLYAIHKLTSDDNVVVSGYPKLDIYNMPYDETKAELMWKHSRGSSPLRKRILWTPHWIVDKSSKYTLFTEYIDFFIEYLEKHSESIELILKPHPLLFETLLIEKVYTKEALNRILERLQSLSNASIYTGGNYFPLFFSSDAIINSSISYMAEYLPTKKPMLFMPNKNDLGTNAFGEQVRKQHYMGYSKQDIEDFITHVVIGNHDPMYKQREEAIQTILYMPHQGAGMFIKEEIERSIHQEPYWQKQQKLLAIRTRLAQKREKQQGGGEKRFLPLLYKHSKAILVYSQYVFILYSVCY